MGAFDFNELMFNVDNGFLEGLVRGFKNGIIKKDDYRHLTQCDTLEGMLFNVMSTHYFGEVSLKIKSMIRVSIFLILKMFHSEQTLLNEN